MNLHVLQSYYSDINSQENLSNFFVIQWTPLKIRLTHLLKEV